MPAASSNRLDRYLRHRRIWEAGLLVAFFLVEPSLNSVVVIMELTRAGASTPAWEPLVWERVGWVKRSATQLAVLARA